MKRISKLFIVLAMILAFTAGVSATNFYPQLKWNKTWYVEETHGYIDQIETRIFNLKQVIKQKNEEIELLKKNNYLEEKEYYKAELEKAINDLNGTDGIKERLENIINN